MENVAGNYCKSPYSKELIALESVYFVHADRLVWDIRWFGVLECGCTVGPEFENRTQVEGKKTLRFRRDWG